MEADVTEPLKNIVSTNVMKCKLVVVERPLCLFFNVYK